MSSVFDKAVVLLGRAQSIEDLTEMDESASPERVRIGAVLSLPVVIANLADWAQDPIRASWLSTYVADADTSSVDVNVSLVRQVDVDELGGGMLQSVLGGRAGETGVRVAERAGVSIPTAHRLLSAAASAVVVLLDRVDGEGQGAGSLSDRLASERRHLVDSGWEGWIDLNTAADVGETDRSMAAGSVLVGAVSAPSSVLVRPPADRPGSSGDLVDQPEPRDERRLTAEPDPDAGELAVGARALRPGTILLAGLAAVSALLFAFSFTQLGGDGDADQAQATESVAGPTTTVEIADQPSSTATPQADESSDTRESGAALPAGSGDVVTVAVIMDDPLQRTPDTGAALLMFNKVTGEVCYEFAVDGITNPYDGHVHSGPAGVKGGIVIDFGELIDSPTGCIENRPIDTNAILDDLAGHYAEFHHPDGVNTVRAQLAARDTAETTTQAEAAAVDRGAVVVIEAGAVVLRGDVPDQVTIDKLIESFADIDLGPSEIVNELTIVPGAPRPSGTITVDNTILFAHDSAVLADPDSTVLADVATIFKARPAWTMTVVGHTDSVGTDVYNLELSLLRAAAVRDALVEAGVDPEALAVEGAGDTDPVATNATLQGRSLNRRIEFKVVAA